MQTAQVEPVVVVGEAVNVSCHGLPLGVCSGSPSSPLRDRLPLEPAWLIVSDLKFRWGLVADLVRRRLVSVDLFDGDNESPDASFFGNGVFL